MGEHAKNAKREGKVRIHFADRWIANWTFTVSGSGSSEGRLPPLVINK